MGSPSDFSITEKSASDFGVGNRVVGLYKSPLAKNLAGLVYENGSVGDNGYWCAGDIISISSNGDVANILCEDEGRRIMNTKRLSNGNDIAIVAM